MGKLGGVKTGGTGNSTGMSGIKMQEKCVEGKAVFDVKTLIISIIIAVLSAVGARMVYGMLVGSLYRPIVIMITVGLFFIIAGLFNIIAYNMRGMYSPQFSIGQVMMYFGIFLAIILVLSLLFEFLYELGGGFSATDAGSYVIIIDDSGSMDSSDPANVRYDAIEDIIRDKSEDFPYAVYRFANEVECVRTLLPKSEGLHIDTGTVGGGTCIRKALERVLDDYKNGSLKNAKKLKVLLLSDGAATDIGLFTPIERLLKEYGKNGISISTVGLGSGVDEGIMTKISEATGGVYIHVTDVASLYEKMTTAIESYYERDLLTYRIVYSGNSLFAFERILFMGIIGALAGAALVLSANGKKQETGIIIAVVKGFVAAIILEMCINGMGLHEKIVDYLYFFLVALVASWMFVSGSNQVPPKSERVKNEEQSEEISRIIGRGGKKEDRSPAKKIGER